MEKRRESGDNDAVLVILYSLHHRTPGLDLSIISVPVWRCALVYLSHIFTQKSKFEEGFHPPSPHNLSKVCLFLPTYGLILELTSRPGMSGKPQSPALCRNNFLHPLLSLPAPAAP